MQGTLGILDNHVSFASIRSLVGRGISHLVASVYNGPGFCIVSLVLLYSVMAGSVFFAM